MTYTLGADAQGRARAAGVLLPGDLASKPGTHKGKCGYFVMTGGTAVVVAGLSLCAVAALVFLKSVIPGTVYLSIVFLGAAQFSSEIKPSDNWGQGQLGLERKPAVVLL